MAIISDSLWRRRYGANPAIVGRQVTVNEAPVTVIGVLPSGTNDLIAASQVPGTEIWTPLGYSPELVRANRASRHVHMVARLRDDATPAEAEVDLTRVFQSLAQRFPAFYDRPRPVVTPLRDAVLGPVTTPLYLLWGAVALLLLITCANVANLLLIRASERGEEIAVRRALGVTPARMLRQLLTESALLGMIGGAAGIAVAFWATALLTANGPAAIPRLDEVSLDPRVLGYAFTLSVATGVLFGLAPARLLIRGPEVTRMSAKRSTAGPGAWRHRAALITVNVALCALLLVGSGLLVRSFARLLTEDAGVTPPQLLTFEVNLTGQRYQQNASVLRFFDDLTARLDAAPGVVNVSSSSMLPLTGSVARMTVDVEGRPLDNPAAAPLADTYIVRLDYFATMGIPVLDGRGFEVTDGERTAPVVVISQAMAGALWPGENPIGRRIRVPGAPVYPLRTIVGIVGDVKHYGLHMPTTMQAYLPHAQPPFGPQRLMVMVVRTAADRDPLSLVSTVRGHVRSIDPLQPVNRIQTFDDIVAQSIATRRFTLVLLALFAGTAVLLAIGGLYGALSYVVSQRTRDIGVRVALGASARAIGGLVLRQGMTPALLGLAAGLVASAAIGRLIESMLFGVSSGDPITYGAVGMTIVASALAACLLPARRAAAINAAVTLRAE